MSLISVAQQFSDDELIIEELLENPEESHDEPITLELVEPEDNEVEITFALPHIPGADDQSELEVSHDGELEVSSPEDHVVVEESDPWDWRNRGLNKFLDWVKERLDNVPTHSGKDTTGLEKCIAYFDAINKEISKAMREDYKNEIDSGKAEKAREEIENAIERLTERYNKVMSSKYKRHSKKNKKSDIVSDGLVKEAQKISGVSGIVVTVPLLISRIARVCINGSVSGGHDIEHIFADQVKKYKLTTREQADVIQLVEDMGYPVMRDRGWLPDESKKRSDEENLDWGPANYPG